MLTTEKEIYLAILTGVSFLAVILTFFVISLLYNQHKIKKIQKALISAEIITLETERKRFSEDLHDEIGPSLSTVLLYINLLENSETVDPEIIEKMGKILTQTLQQIRSISQNITPKYLQEQGLEMSIGNMVNNFNKGLNRQTALSFQAHDIPDDLTEYHNLNIYRIVQEAVNNAIKHADAEEIRVDVAYENDKLNVIISDNGIGFDRPYNSHSSVNPAGIGLKNIQNRVIFLGGQLNIYSQKGKGTQVVAEIPVV